MKLNLKVFEVDIAHFMDEELLNIQVRKFLRK